MTADADTYAMHGPCPACDHFAIRPDGDVYRCDLCDATHAVGTIDINAFRTADDVDVTRIYKGFETVDQQRHTDRQPRARISPLYLLAGAAVIALLNPVLGVLFLLFAVVVMLS